MGYPNSAPFEIIGAPFTLWIAPLSTAKPAIDDDMADFPVWVKVGTSGDLNYLDEGVTIEHSQAMSFFRAAGDAGSRKAFRTEEDLKVRLTLVDVTLEQYALALEHNSVTDTPASGGVVGFRKIGLSRGLRLTSRALLVRGPSPYGDNWTRQYFLPRVVQTGNPSLVGRKGEPQALPLEWTALVDPSATPEEYFGVLEAQDAVS